MFKEEDAIESIKVLLNFNDISRMRQMLNKIDPEVFKNADIEQDFKELLANMYNTEDLSYLKELLNDFIRVYNQHRGVFHFGFCSEEFRNKFKRRDFNNPFELNQFRELIIKIIEYGITYQKETKGEFYTSPKGHVRYRVVWFVKNNAVYFCEQFHHDREYDEFCDKASGRKISRKDYHNWIYADEFRPLNLKAA